MANQLGVVERSTFPSLSESSFLRYFTFCVLYIAQGIPEGILYYTIPAWLAINGKSPGEIGSYVAVIAIPWSLKIFNAPIMDRFTYLPMGRRRPWVIFGQFGLIISFLSMALIANPLDNLLWLMILGFIVNFFGVSQDIAVDGMAIDLLPIDQQARANGLMWGSKTVGTSASVALGSIILNQYGYFYAIVSFSLIIMLIIIVPIVFRERQGERLFPWTKGEASKTSANLQLHNWGSLFKSLLKVFFLPVSIIMGIAVFSVFIGRGLIDTLLPIFTVQELGWSDTTYTQVFSIATLISGFAGMFIGGALVDFYGKKRMIAIYLSSLVFLIIIMFSFSKYWSNPDFVIGFIIAFYILITFTNIAIFATAMSLCWKRVAATQFTLYMAISNMGLAVGAGIIGPLKDIFSWEYVFLTYIIFVLVMLALLKFINFDKHQYKLEKLEQGFND